MPERVPSAISSSAESPLTAASDAFGGLAAMLDEARNQFRARQFEEASACLAKLLAKAQALLSAGQLNGSEAIRVSGLRACALTLDGRCAEERGMQDCARERWAQAVAIFDENLPRPTPSSDSGLFRFATWVGETFGGGAQQDLPPDLLGYYGVALRMTGRRTEAISVLRQVVRMKAGTRETYRHLGLALKDEGALEEAVEQLRIALERSPSDIPSWRGLTESLEKLDRKAEASRAYLDLAQALTAANRPAEALAAAADSFRLNDSDPAAVRYYADALRVANRGEEALAVIDQALAADPNDGVAWAIKGAALHNLRREEEAVEAFDHALVANPSDAWTLAIKGEALMTQAKFAEGEAALRQAVSLNRNFAGAHAMLGWALCELGRLEAGLAEAEKACALDPGDVFALGVRGTALYRLECYEESLQAFEQATRIAGAPAFTWAGKADALQALGRLDEALGAIDRALERDPENVPATMRKARILYSAGDPAKREKGVELLNKALTLHPTAEEATEIALALLNADRAEDAVHAADQALDSATPPASAFFLKGEALQLTGRAEEALTIVEEGLRRVPEAQAAYGLGLKGQSLTAMGRMADAEAAFRESIRIDPSLAWTWRELSRLLASSDPQQSLEAAERSLNLNPNDAGTLALKADALEALGRRSEAIEPLHRAAELDRNSAWLRLRLADLYVQTGQNDHALQQVEECLSKDPGSGLAHGLRGYIVHSMGEAAEAEQELLKAIELGAGPAWVHAELASVLREMEKPDRALAAVDKALEMEPESASAMEIKGQIFVAIGEFAAAIELFDAAIARGAAPYFWKGLALDNLEQIEDARQYYEKSLEIDREDVWSQRALADVYLLQNRVEDGRKIFEAILVRMSSQTRGPYDVGLCAWCHYGCGRLEPAIRLYAEALSLDREAALKSGPFDLGLISAAAQRYSQSVREYDRAIDLAAQAHPWIQKNLFGVAISDLQRAMKVRYPAIAEVTEVQQCLKRLKNAYEKASAGPGRPRVE